METEHPTLAALRTGESGRVERLHMAGRIRSRLLDIGLIPGTLVTCVLTGRGIAAYRIRGAVIALRSRDAEGIEITV